MSSKLPVLIAYAGARRRRFADRAELQAWQAARLRKVLARAKTAFPFYAGVTGTGLDAFAVLTKATMASHFAELNDRGLGLDDCLAAARAAEARRDFTASLAGVSIGLSSGTSGRQSVFLTSPAERAQWAGTILAKALPGGLRAGARVALVLRAGGPLYESVGGGRISFSFFDLAVPMQQHLAGLAQAEPTVLAAPPSALRLLAAAREQGRLAIAPERIFSIAEVLDPHDQVAIEAAFGCRVDQIYQATEGFLGISCSHGSLHLNEDVLIFEREPVDPAGRRFTPVITDLFRRTQAMIRVRLDDILIEGAEPCPCGSPLQVIERVEGRSDDVLMLPPSDGSGALRPLFADFVRSAVLAAAGVRDFHVLQPDPGVLRLGVEPSPAWPAARQALLGQVASSGLRAPRVEQVPFSPARPPAKLRRVRRDFALPG